MPAGEQPPGEGSALDRMGRLPERGKEPASARVLDTWIAQAQRKLGMDAGRLGWLIASTVVVAALQRAVDETGRSLFLLKGGTYLQHRMSWATRPTKDVDGLVRGDLDTLLEALDQALRLPWGPLTLTRTEPEVIAAPARVVKPRRFDVGVSLRGQVWRRIQVEVAPDEAGAGDEQDVLAAPGLGHFGLPNPEFLLGIALRYQVALFTARATEARTLAREGRGWPPRLVAHPHWSNDYDRAARQAGVDLPLGQGRRRRECLGRAHRNRPPDVVEPHPASRQSRRRPAGVRRAVGSGPYDVRSGSVCSPPTSRRCACSTLVTT